MPYDVSWARMRAFTDARDARTADEIWLLEHPPVYTLGQAGRREHLLDAGTVPVVSSDRGGQITYHGPGQLVAYVLMDVRRARLGVRTLVAGLEDCVIECLSRWGIEGRRRERAPGVYVGGRKIAALGLRVRNGRTYHGVAVNVDLDPEPFARIEPCGFRGMEVTRMADLAVPAPGVGDVAEAFVTAFTTRFGYHLPPTCPGR